MKFWLYQKEHNSIVFCTTRDTSPQDLCILTLRSSTMLALEGGGVGHIQG